MTNLSANMLMMLMRTMNMFASMTVTLTAMMMKLMMTVAIMMPLTTLRLFDDDPDADVADAGAADYDEAGGTVISLWQFWPSSDYLFVDP